MSSSLTRLHRTTLKLRASLIRQQTRHIQRLQKTLEGANIKLDSVIVGMSGRAMIEALIAGQTDPAKPAALANYRIKQLREAPRGRVTDHHRASCYVYTCSRSTSRMRRSATSIGKLPRSSPGWHEEVEAGQASFQTLISLLMTIPGSRSYIALPEEEAAHSSDCQPMRSVPLPAFGLR
jgi:transposase